MLDYLEKLRKKPEAERRKVVFRISFGITLVVAFFWVGSLFFKEGTVQKTEETNHSIPSLKETFSNFFSSVGQIFTNNQVFENTKSAITELGGAVDSPVTDLPSESSTSTYQNKAPDAAVSEEIVQ